MLKWARRIGGSGISFVSGVFSSKGFQVVDFLHGLPGSINDSKAWKALVEKVDMETAVYASFMIAGLLIAASELWWPRLSRWVQRIRANGETQEALGEDAASRASSPREERPKSNSSRLEACRPQIERCRQLLMPYSGPLGHLEISMRQAVIGGFNLVELKSELEYLARRLDKLRIPSPAIPSAADKTVGQLHRRFRDWSWYLAKLKVSVSQDDIEGSRLLWVDDGQATSS